MVGGQGSRSLLRQPPPPGAGVELVGLRLCWPEKDFLRPKAGKSQPCGRQEAALSPWQGPRLLGC